MKKHVLLFLMCLATVACNKKSKETDVVCVHDRQVISLSSNPTTGYLWQISLLPEGQDALEIQEDYLPDTPQLNGSGGTSKFKLFFVKEGKVTLILRYFRPWEKFNPATDKEKKFSYTVKKCVTPKK